VSQSNLANDLALPFNQRWAVGFWNAAFFKDRRFEPDSTRSAQWNTGAYLATALGHCGECHTPRNAAFGLRRGEEFAGAELEGWRAYNITPDPTDGIGGWRPEEIAAYLKTGVAAGHAAAGGPMSLAVAHSLQYLDDGDREALVAYLLGVPARTGSHRIDIDAAPASLAASTDLGPAPSVDAAHTQGLRLFEGACASCHRWDGSGRQSAYAALVGTRGVNDAEGTNVTQAILQGADVTVGDRHVYMPAFAAYSNTEVAALANFVIGQFGGKTGRVTPEGVARARED
jgi:mono/diheme cytochrome c family protein